MDNLDTCRYRARNPHHRCVDKFGGPVADGSAKTCMYEARAQLDEYRFVVAAGLPCELDIEPDWPVCGDCGDNYSPVDEEPWPYDGLCGRCADRQMGHGHRRYA